MSEQAITHKYRLLVIDDNRAIHDDFRKILAPETPLDNIGDIEADLFGSSIKANDENHFEIDSAYQGKEGLEMVNQSLQNQQPYSIAFVDMRMPPGWDGIQTIEHIWEVDPELQIVICSAYSDHSWSEISKRLGNSDRLLILKKPFDNVEIIQMAHAMSHKCALNRMAMATDHNNLTNNTTTSDVSEAELNARLPMPIEDIKKAMTQLQQGFAEISANIDKFQRTLENADPKNPSAIIHEMQNEIQAAHLDQLQSGIPNAFERLQAGVQLICENIEDIKDGQDETDSTVH